MLDAKAIQRTCSQEVRMICRSEKNGGKEDVAMSEVKNTSVLDSEGQSTALQCYEVTNTEKPATSPFTGVFKKREGGVKNQ